MQNNIFRRLIIKEYLNYNQGINLLNFNRHILLNFNRENSFLNYNCGLRNLNTVRSLSSKFLIPTVLQNQKPIRKTNTEIIIDLIKHHKNDPSTFKVLKKEFIESGENVNAKNVDALILHCASVSRNFAFIEEYVKYLMKENVTLNIGILGKIFKAYYFMDENGYKSSMSEDDIYERYTSLRKTYKVLDPYTGDNVVCALSVTKYFKECFKVLEEIKIISEPSVEAYCAVAASAFVNGEEEIGWGLLDKVIESGKPPLSNPYLKYLNFCKNLNEEITTKLNKIERLFYHFEANDLMCPEDVKQEIINAYQELQHPINITNISFKGSCHNCKRILQKLHLSKNEFNVLKEAFFRNVIIGKNVYTKTDPKELERFQSFVDNMDKFDVVVDGLNVAFSAGKQSKEVASSMVLSVVNHFASQNKKVLVIGRKHMQKWSSKNMRALNNKATVFYTDDLSYDDPFLLYCALSCGMNTKIISRDLMRSHIFLMKDITHKRLLSKWLTNSLYQLIWVDNQGVANFKQPVQYLKCAQKEEKFWHIPCASHAEVSSRNKEDWLCIRH